MNGRGNMAMRQRGWACLLAVALATTVGLKAAEINFDDVPDGTVITNHYPGVTFEWLHMDGTNYVYGDAVAVTTSNMAYSIPNVISPAATAGAGDYGWFTKSDGYVFGRFTTPVRSVSVWTHFQVGCDWLDLNIPGSRMDAYDSSGHWLTNADGYGSMDVGGACSMSVWHRLTITTNDIGMVVFSSNSGAIWAQFDTFGFDLGIYSPPSINVSGGGWVCTSPKQPTYPYGTLVTLTAMSMPGWSFNGWSGDTNGSVNPLQITITGDRAIMANFVSTVPNVTVDDPAATFQGTWTNDTQLSGKYRSSYAVTSASGDPHTNAVFTPHIVTAGYYDWYEWHPDTQGVGTTLAKYVVLHDGNGTVTNTVNQSQNGGQWNLLQSHLAVDAGTHDSIRLFTLTKQTGKGLFADAIRLVWSTQQDAVPSVTSFNVNSGCAAVTWEAVPGRTYRLQYKNDLSNPQWNDLLGDAAATDCTASKLDCSLGSAKQRFYRVLLIP